MKKYKFILNVNVQKEYCFEGEDYNEVEKKAIKTFRKEYPNLENTEDYYAENFEEIN